MNEETKKQILSALSHPEASEGLYLANFLTKDAKEDERPGIDASTEEILRALEGLITSNLIILDENAGKVVFRKKS